MVAVLRSWHRRVWRSACGVRILGQRSSLTLSDFSFAKSRKQLESFNGSFSDAVIEERDETR